MISQCNVSLEIDINLSIKHGEQWRLKQAHARHATKETDGSHQFKRTL